MRQECVENRGAAAACHRCRLPVDADPHVDGCIVAVGPVERERVALERHVALDVYPRVGCTASTQGGLDEIHERCRPADERLIVVVQATQFVDGRGVGHTTFGFQPVADPQPVGMTAREVGENPGEDHGLAVTIGVEQFDRALLVRQSIFRYRHDGCDTATGREQAKCAVPLRRGEHAGRRERVQRGPCCDVVAQPIGTVAILGALDGDRREVIHAGRRAQRVAARHRARAFARYPQRDELTRQVGDLAGEAQHECP